MAEWSVLESSEPELAAKIQARFVLHPHHVLGTINSAGAPRLSGINIFFNDGFIWFGSMPGAMKLLDILRDPRVSVHSATLSEHLAGGDAVVSGRAVQVSAHDAAAWRPQNPNDGAFFKIDIDDVHLVEVINEQLVITMWDTEHGLRIVHRQ